jgi:CRISPR/Cas system-associated exonuclease Cas4 (RecB family)
MTSTKSRFTLPAGLVRTDTSAGKTLLSKPEIILPESSGTDRPTTPHLSVTQLNMFLRCGKQYWYRYICGFKEKPSVSLSIGKGGHEALEWNTKTKIRTGEDAPEDAVIQKASDLIDHHMREIPASEIEKDVEPGGYKDKMLAATRVYRRRDAPSITPVGAEIEFNLDVAEYLPEDYNLVEPIRIVNGKIDVIEDDTEVLLSHEEAIRLAVNDYKYVKRMKSQAEVDMTPQLTTYNAVIHKLTQKLPTKLGFRIMHPGTKAEGPDSKVLLRDPAYMTPEALKKRMARVAMQFASMEVAIKNDVFMPTDDPIKCSYCGFRERCQNSLVDETEAAIIRQRNPQPAD